MEDSVETPGLTLYANGLYVRHPVPSAPANSDYVEGVASKDFSVDKELKLWVRVYNPKTGEGHKLLPVIVYYHGGGFITCSADNPEYDILLRKLCGRADAVVVSVNYRLAPEHPLPAAYEDGLAALEWLNSVAAELHADMSRVFVMGDSAGGNLAHHVSVKVSEDTDSEVRFSGQILLQPFFGGVSHTASELKPAGSESLKICNAAWKVALPKDANRDHGYSNVPAKLQDCGDVVLPRTLVIVGGEDPLLDRQIEYVRVLRELGKEVELVRYENANHGFYYFDVNCEEIIDLVDKVSAFIH